MILDCVDERLVDVFGEFDFAVLFLGHVLLEFDVETAEFEFDALKRFAEGFVVVADRRFGALAEGQREIRVRLLTVVIGADCVHPQNHLFFIFVLVIVLVADDRRSMGQNGQEENVEASHVRRVVKIVDIRADSNRFLRSIATNHVGRTKTHALADRGRGCQ